MSLAEHFPPTNSLVNWPKVADGMGYKKIVKPLKLQIDSEIAYPIDETHLGGKIWMYYGIVQSVSIVHSTPLRIFVSTINDGVVRRTEFKESDMIYLKEKV